MNASQFTLPRQQRRLSEPCPFCGTPSAILWYDPDYDMRPFQVVCGLCGARGPRCDCGEESAVPAWLGVEKKKGHAND